MEQKINKLIEHEKFIIHEKLRKLEQVAPLLTSLIKEDDDDETIKRLYKLEINRISACENVMMKYNAIKIKKIELTGVPPKRGRKRKIKNPVEDDCMLF